MGWHLDGRVTAVVGTHTHVQTADERLLPKGTAYLTDAGMTGPHDSIIGVTVDAALGRFVTGMPAKFEAASGTGRLNAVIVTADPATGRALPIERLNLSAADVEALAATTARVGARLTIRETCSRSRSRDVRPLAALRRTIAPPPQERRVVTVSELTAPIRGLARIRFRRRLGRGGDLQLPDLEHRARVLHAEGRQRADPRRHVPLGRALPEVQARRRPARGGARPAGRLRAEGRVPAALRAHAAARPRRAAAGVRAAEEEARRPKASSTRRASGRCRRCRARSASSPRSTARRCATSSRCCARRHPNAHLVIRPARVQGEGAAADIADAVRAHRPGRRRRCRHRRPRRRLGRGPLGVQRGVGGAGDRRLPGPGRSRPSATRRTSRSPTSSPTCARRRPSAAAEMVVAAKDEFCSRVSIGWRTACSAAARHGLQRRRAPAARAQRAGAASPAGRRAWRCAAGTPPSSRTSCARMLTALAEQRARVPDVAAAARSAATCGAASAAMRGRLAAPTGRLHAGVVAARTTAPRRAWVRVAGRLESLSPLAVLGARLRGLLERRPHGDRPRARPALQPATTSGSRCTTARIALRASDRPRETR